MANEVREPRQERSIEKKNKIITAGYELFSEVGYYGTNTAEIAKKAVPNLRGNVRLGIPNMLEAKRIITSYYAE